MLRYMIAASCCGVWVGERSGRPTSPTKRVSPVKTEAGRSGCAAIVHQNANALECVSRSVQEPEAAVAELNLVSVLDRDVRELSAGSRAEIDLRSGAFRQFAMSRHEVGMEVSLDNVFDLPILAGCRFEVDIHIALGIDDGCDALRRNHVRGVGQAAQIESLHLYRFHAVSPGQIVVFAAASTAAAPPHADTAGPYSNRPGISSPRLHWTRHGTMITSSPGFQFTGVATWCLAVSCMESSTRSTSSKLRPVVIG